MVAPIYRPQDQLIDFLFFRQMHIADRSTEPFHATFSYHRHHGLRRPYNFKSRNVTECDLLPTATAMTETGKKKNLSSKLRPANFIM